MRLASTRESPRPSVSSRSGDGPKVLSEIIAYYLGQRSADRRDYPGRYGHRSLQEAAVGRLVGVLLIFLLVVVVIVGIMR